MKNFKIFLILIFSVLLMTTIYSQEIKKNSPTFFIDGTDLCNSDFNDFDDSPIEDNDVVFVSSGPTIIKNVSRNMKTAGYWISKIKNPDKEILTSKQIQEKNKELFKDLIYLNNIDNFKEEVKTSPLKKQQAKIFRLFRHRKYIDSSFKLISKKHVEQVYKNIKFPGAKKIKVQYAITTNYSDIRLLPDDTNYIYSETTYDIDRLQVAGVDLGEPLIALLKTKDKNWTYVISYTSEGWIKTKDIAFTSKQTFSNWINEKNFVIVTNSKTEVYLDKSMTKYYDYVRMSTKLPFIKNINDETVCVKIPKATNKGNLFFEKAYISKKDTNKGYLKYTQKNVLQQAFKHINSPYSWGGYDGEQDCSTFIRQVFGCFGLILPRNSLAQIKSGNKQINLDKNLFDEEKNKIIISNSTPAISLLYLPGHIMIYIGNEKNKPYVIHAIWGTEHFTNKKTSTVSFIQRVIVSNLEIGKGTSKGSLLERLTKVNTLILKK